MTPPAETDKKERILEAATEVFAKYGFKKASIDDIAEAANVGKGTVYLVCKNKQDLFYQTVHRELRLWVNDVAQWMDRRKPADQLMVECTIRAQQYLEQRPLVRDLLLGNYDEVFPLWSEELQDLRVLGRQNMIETLRLGIQQKVFRPELDVEEIAKLLQDMLAMGIVVAFREKRTQHEQLRTAQVGLDLVLKGLLAR